MIPRRSTSVSAFLTWWQLNYAYIHNHRRGVSQVREPPKLRCWGIQKISTRSKTRPRRGRSSTRCVIPAFSLWPVALPALSRSRSGLKLGDKTTARTLMGFERDPYSEADYYRRYGGQRRFSQPRGCVGSKRHSSYTRGGGSGGGGGFFLACEDLGRMFNHSFPAYVFFFLFFFKWRLSRAQ